jgi:hypothetical protein
MVGQAAVGVVHIADQDIFSLKIQSITSERLQFRIAPGAYCSMICQQDLFESFHRMAIGMK